MKTSNVDVFKVKDVILDIEGLKKYFFLSKKNIIKAVDGVTFQVYKGETLGLVGESGCGKSTLGRTVIRLYNPTEGKVKFKGKDVHALKGKELKEFHKKMQMIFQDPYASLNPRMKVLDIIAEGLDIHGLKSKSERTERVVELLQIVGLNSEHKDRFPHEFSGGQRQRIGIARALAVDPEFIIADEAISALDVSIQAQVVNLLKDLQLKKGLTYLFIAHDLSMVKYISDRVGVMYMGKLVELAKSDELYLNPLHPYTKLLLAAVPVPDPKIARKRERIVLTTELVHQITASNGCKFYARCPKATDSCKEDPPLFREVKEDHWVACHLYEK